MIICGFKLTHDGALALVDDGRLIFSYEMEKIRNNPRHSTFNCNFSQIEEILNEHGYKFSDVDRIVIDGWTPDIPVFINLDDRQIPVKLAGYGSLITKESLLKRQTGFIHELGIEYSSYFHITGHLASAYCTSSFAKKQEDSYVLIWDGGMFPHLFYYRYKLNLVENLGILFQLIGNIYSIFAQHFGPFKKCCSIHDDLSVAGKVMAYIALGRERQEIIKYFEDIYEGSRRKGMGFANSFAKAFQIQIAGRGFSDEDILCSFHIYLQNLIVKTLTEKIKHHGHECHNFCFAGGSALNIKWNSAIRDTGLFKEVWVPPFPNDSGSAIGAACSEMITQTGVNQLQWNVYCGPGIAATTKHHDWDTENFSIEDLARLLRDKAEPVVFLNERTELGPRALGNRSIFASPTSIRMKELLNVIKDREDYRPVAPICLEEDASAIFHPGSRDPFMLFDHHIQVSWKNKVPAVVHLDDTARLQTVSEADNPKVYKLLQEYKRLTGIPLLCNTSANFKGRGFFPDVSSAMKWDKVNYIWCNGILYKRKKKVGIYSESTERCATLDMLKPY